MALQVIRLPCWGRNVLVTTITIFGCWCPTVGAKTVTNITVALLVTFKKVLVNSAAVPEVQNHATLMWLAETPEPTDIGA